MDLTGIFRWLNDLSAWIGGFFDWLPKEIHALVQTVILAAKDGLLRASVWAAKGIFGVIDTLGLPTYDIHGLIGALGTAAVDFLIAAGLITAIKTVFAVKITMWAIGLIFPRAKP